MLPDVSATALIFSLCMAQHPSAPVACCPLQLENENCQVRISMCPDSAGKARKKNHAHRRRQRTWEGRQHGQDNDRSSQTGVR